MQTGNPLSADKLTNIFRTSPKDPLRIINREGSTIEFKESYSHAGMAQYFKTIAAFANNAGGYIIFGVGDKPRRLLGLKDKNLFQFKGSTVTGGRKSERADNRCDGAFGGERAESGYDRCRSGCKKLHLYLCKRKTLLPGKFQNVLKGGLCNDSI